MVERTVTGTDLPVKKQAGFLFVIDFFQQKIRLHIHFFIVYNKGQVVIVRFQLKTTEYRR
ncbi:MAG: hypothetical protein ACOX0J_12365 [Thermoactinomyces vulgaris]|jgi:hypothetical protein|nr:hypothetical protein ATH33_2145 [Thermoactinomyces vulgaris]